MNQAFEEEISLKEILNIFNKRKNLIVASIIIFTLISAVFIVLPKQEIQKEYEAVSSISIIYNYKAPENPEEIGEGYVFYQDRLQEIMMPTINGYAQSFSILNSVITELDVKDNKGEFLKAKNLSEDVKIEAQPGSNLIRITVNYKDEKIAKAIADKIPEKLIQISKANSQLSDYQINIIDYAISSEVEKKELSKGIILLIGILTGIMVGLFLAFAFNYFSKKIQSKSDVQSMGYDIELVIKNMKDLSWKSKLISLTKLSNPNSIILGIDDITNSDLYGDLIESLKIENLDVEALSYKDDNFLIKSKCVDKTYIFVQESVSDIDTLQQIAKFSTKYGIDTSIVYFEK